MHVYLYIYRVYAWSNGYRHWLWAWWYEFKYWMMFWSLITLIANNFGDGSSLIIYLQFSIRIKAKSVIKRWYFFFLCFGRGTSVARRDHWGDLTLSESCQGYCRSRYDAEITWNRQWTQRITEDLPDASKMYDWKKLVWKLICEKENY